MYTPNTYPIYGWMLGNVGGIYFVPNRLLCDAAIQKWMKKQILLIFGFVKVHFVHCLHAMNVIHAPITREPQKTLQLNGGSSIDTKPQLIKGCFLVAQFSIALCIQNERTESEIINIVHAVHLDLF